MRRIGLRRQDGFIREILWVCLVLAVIAVVVLDAIALIAANRSVDDDAARAAREARTEYVDSLDARAAQAAASAYLVKSGVEMTGFSSSTGSEGAVVFTVTAQAHADTYVFRYVGRIPGLGDWVERVSNPSATRSSG
jgi:Flp pilus assembly protein TadG